MCWKVRYGKVIAIKTFARRLANVFFTFWFNHRLQVIYVDRSWHFLVPQYLNKRPKSIKKLKNQTETQCENYMGLTCRVGTCSSMVTNGRHVGNIGKNSCPPLKSNLSTKNSYLWHLNFSSSFYVGYRFAMQNLQWVSQSVGGIKLL